MRNPEWIVIALLALILAAFVALEIDKATADHVPVGSGVVVKKEHVGATSRTGVGIASNGRSSGPVVVVSSTPEKWVLLIRHGNEVFSVEVTSGSWGAIEEGAKVEVLEIRGMLGTWGKTIR